MPTETWLLGPPGTGKTTRLAAMIAEAAKQHGSDGVLVSSFTKAAAVELAGRDLPLDHARVGTLHALCYRAMGQPPIAEANLREFNDEHPEHALSGGTTVSDEGVWEYEPRTENDAYFAAYQGQRARMIPPMKQRYNGGFDPSYMAFVLAWEGWKRQHEYFDFSDLLERALHDMDGSPIDASVLFIDEAQDCTPLMMAVARKWAQQMERLVLAFDEEQSLYSWAGADPQQLFSREPDEPATVLAQSYRVPRAVHAKADAWRKKLSWRIEKEYLPRDEDGWVKNRLDLDYDSPDLTVQLISDLIGHGKSVMVLASCGYMLRSTINRLKAEGIPFANPYRPGRTDWNPLDPGTARKQTPVSRVKAYLRVSEAVWGRDARVWNTEDFKAWAPHIRAEDLFKRGTKSQIMSKDFSLPANDNERIAAIGSLLMDSSADLPADRHFGTALEGNLDWLADRLMGDTGERMKYPLRIAQKLGPRTLLEKPKVTVGTIHSVKGAEADVVILFPDISALGHEEWRESGPRRDSVIRQFYVACTRAREGLVFAGNNGPRYVPLWQP